MLTPRSLSLFGFKCFSGQLHFSYPSEPGLYFVTGRNEVDPELEANACGKSTLFCDAPCWCLYGKTPRGLRASDIVSWTESTSKVKFDFWLNEQLFQVTRSQHPNSLFLSVENGPVLPVTQEELDKKLGIDYAAFCNSVVFSQLTTLFFDLKPAEKSEMLESVLPLDVWEAAVKHTKTKIDALDDDVQQNLRSISELRGKLFATNEIIEASDSKIEEWEQVRETEIGEIEGSFAEDDANLTKYGQQLGQLNQKHNELKGLVEESTALMEESQGNYNDLYRQMTKLDYKSSSLASEAGGIQQEMKRLADLGPVCVVCKQKIDSDHLQTEQSRLNEQLVRISSEMLLVKKEHLVKKDELKATAEAVAEVKAYQTTIKRELDEVWLRSNKLKTTIAQILDDKTKKQARIVNLRARVNPFIEQKQRLMLEKRRLSRLVVQGKAKVAELQEKLECTRFWLQGFKEVKLMLISDILTQLELEVNSYLYQFGLRDWKVEFAVDSTTKAGKQRKGFTVTIKAPGLESAVSWSAWSGGETQRLRLAGALGMADLILACFGLSPGLEVYDEPSTYLSAQGVTDLIASLRDRSIDTGRMIFFIDHKNLDTSHFSGLYTVVKSDEAVTVESSV